MGIAYQIVDDLLEFLEELEDKKSTQESVTLPQIYGRTMGREEAVERTIAEVTDMWVCQRPASSFRPGCKEKLLLITDHITMTFSRAGYESSSIISISR